MCECRGEWDSAARLEPHLSTYWTVNVLALGASVIAVLHIAGWAYSVGFGEPSHSTAYSRKHCWQMYLP